MIRIVYTLLLVLCIAPAFGQQEAMYTQYMFNKLAVNPAYAGSRGSTSITLLYRDQWTGFDGAPKTATASIHGHLRNPKLALGLQVVSDRHGLQNNIGLMATYAYRLPLGNGRLSFGVQAGFTHYQYSLTDAVSLDMGDPNLQSVISLLTPNVGAGIYYQSARFYAGVSAPKLIQNQLISLDLETSGALSAQEYRHYLGMVGAVLKLNENVKFRPGILVKYAPNAPVQADINATFLFVDRVWVGATYRSNASVDAHVEFNINKQIRVGYAYDFTMGRIGDYSAGSHELLVGIDLDFGNTRIVTPRKMTPRYF
ncbi:MAG: type IX secretion system PorP/SprF family membrane protein [Limisphaerales bacterium]|jgi:type IX secretion system PorP/SprF family membrane protein